MMRKCSEVERGRPLLVSELENTLKQQFSILESRSIGVNLECTYLNDGLLERIRTVDLVLEQCKAYIFFICRHDVARSMIRFRANLIQPFVKILILCAQALKNFLLNIKRVRLDGLHEWRRWRLVGHELANKRNCLAESIGALSKARAMRPITQPLIIGNQMRYGARMKCG